MMKIFILIALIISGTTASINVNNLNIQQYIKNADFHRLIQKPFEKIQFSKCPKFLSDLRNFSQDSAQCILDSYNPNIMSLCQILENKLKQCMDPGKSFLEFCFPVASKDVPAYVVDTVASVVSYICRSKASVLRELRQLCVYHSLNLDNICTKKLEKDLSEMLSIRLPSKSSLCKLLHDYRQCFEGQVTCKNSTTKQIAVDLLDAVEKPCIM